jgi:putative ABC transport system permease protein
VIVALRLAYRDWRGGDLSLLLVAMIMAVAIVTGIGLFTERLGNAILAQSSDLLGADLVLSAPRPVADVLLLMADERGLRRSHSIAFATMTVGAERFQLASVKAVDSHYPLKGEVVLATTVSGAGVAASESALRPGAVWADQRLLDALGLSIGQFIEIGEARLRLEQVLLNEPGAGSDAMALGPRLLMHIDDLPRTEVVQPGSRVRHRYYFAGAEAQIAQWREQLEPHLLPEHRVYSVTEGRPGLNQAITRAQSYLMLGAALGATLAGGAIAIAARRYGARHVGQVAVLKTLGVSGRRIAALYLWKLAALALVATLLGWLLGWIMQAGIVSILTAVLGVGLRAASVYPYVLGAATAIACLLAFVMPPLLALREVSALAALRRDQAVAQPGLGLSALLGLLGLWSLMLWYTRDVWLSLAVLGGLLLALMAVAVLAWWLIRSTGLIRFQAGNMWLLATSSLRRRGIENAMQMAVFALTLMLILVLIIMRSSVIGQWRQDLPPDLPNHFLINISPDDRDRLVAWLDQQGLPHTDLFPVVRARLTHVDGDPLNARLIDDSSAPTQLDRELSLTSRVEPPADNTLVEGRWWGAEQAVAEVSVEAGLASSLGITLGSELRFQVGSQPFLASVSSIRGVNWENMRPNFYMILHPSVLAPYPQTYMTSFYLPATEQPPATDNLSGSSDLSAPGKLLLSDLVRRFPTLTVIEIDAIIGQIQTIIAQVSLAVVAILWVLMACGLLVLIATIQAGLPERFRESAVLRTLGAPARLVWGSITIEFLLLGLLAGLLAALGAEATTALLQRLLFRSEWQFHPWLWFLGPLLGGLVITVIGAITSHKVVTIPPVTVFRTLQ